MFFLIFYQGKERRTIRQFHFTAWPDKGVPAYASSLVHFHSKVIHTPGTLKGPMIVHCRYDNNLTGCQVKVLFTCPKGLNYTFARRAFIRYRCRLRQVVFLDRHQCNFAHTVIR